MARLFRRPVNRKGGTPSVRETLEKRLKIEKELFVPELFFKDARQKGLPDQNSGQVLADLGFSRKRAMKVLSIHFRSLGVSQSVARTQATNCINRQFLPALAKQNKK